VNRGTEVPFLRNKLKPTQWLLMGDRVVAKNVNFRHERVSVLGYVAQYTDGSLDYHC
jgi:hypothetical protein